MRHANVPRHVLWQRYECACSVCASHRRPLDLDGEGVGVSGARGPIEERLAFGFQAAAIQLELSQLVVKVATLFTHIHSTGSWPSSDGQRSRSWADRGVELVDEWISLEPPRTLAPVWEELSAQFDVLVGLLQAVPELSDQVDGKLSASTTVLQAAFNQQLHIANEWEAKLFEEERRLRQSAGGDGKSGQSVNTTRPPGTRPPRGYSTART
jgi:hypothetical protein